MKKKRILIKFPVLWITLGLVSFFASYSPVRAYLKTGVTIDKTMILSRIAKDSKDGGPFVQLLNSAAGMLATMFFQGQGVAPTGDPGLGFEIDGDLNANTPTANTTDWVDGSAGTGVGVMTNAGIPVNSLTTFHITDAWDSSADDVFSGGLKYDDNPNTWTWTTKKSTSKDDINHGLVHVSNDINNHLWLSVAGDRLSTSGNSYIDFEFLQSKLTANANGTFTSAGPDGGRTVGDLLITLELTMGGSQPNFFVERWQQVSPGVFGYVAITPASNTVFAASNASGMTPVPYGAFGSTTYAMNAFAEGAIDISALISNLDPCILIKTVLIKSKASQDANATLKDFITPIQLNLGTSPVANAGPDLIECQANPGPNVFTVNGTATNGTASWSQIGSTGTASATIVSPLSAVSNVNVTGLGTVTLRLTVNNPLCGISTDDVILEVAPNAIADAGPDQVLCQDLAGGSTVFTIDSVVTSGSVINWIVTGTTGTAGATVLSPNSSKTDVSVTGTGTVTLQISANAGGCGIATDTIVLTVNPSPTASAGSNQQKCQSSTGTTVFSLAGSVTNGSPSWSVVGTTGTALAQIVSSNSATTNVNVTGVGTVTLSLISSSLGLQGCGTATSEVVLTVYPLPNAEAGSDKQLTCLQNSVQLDGSSATPGVNFSWSGPNGFTSSLAKPSVTAPGTYSLTVTNPATGCFSTDSVIVTQNIAAPNANAGPDMTLTCSVNQVTLSGSSTTPFVSFSWNGPNGFTSAIANPTVTEPGTYILTTIISETGCTAIDTVVVAQNITAPNVSAGPDKTLTCTASQVVLNGSSSTQGATFSWSGPGGFSSTSATPTVSAPGTYTLTVTNPVTGCPATDTVLVTQDTTAPNVSAGPDKTLTCSGSQVMLNGSSTTQGATFSWSGPGGFSSTSATPTVSAPGTYTLTVSNPVNGCIAVDTTIVSQNLTPPNANAGADKSLTCNLSSVTLDGSSTTPGATFKWSGPNGFSSTLASPTVSVPGNYILTVTNPSNGCTDMDSVVVTQDAGAPTANAGPDKTLTCSVTSVTLNGSSTTPGATFKWSGPNGFSSTSASPVVSAPGNYILTATNPSNGCTSMDTVVVIQDVSQIDTTITSASSVCASSIGNTASVPDAGMGATYQWSVTNGTITGGQGTRILTWSANPVGPVTLNVTVTTSGNGCSSSNSKQVTVSPLPNTLITAPVSACELSTGISASVPNAGQGATYQWSITNGTITGGQGTPNIIWTAGQSGTVILNITVTAPGNGCSAGGSVIVPITAQPTANAGPDQTISACATSVKLSGSIGGGANSAVWSGGQGTFVTGVNDLNATYIPTQEELAAGSVKLTLTAGDPGTGCGTAFDEVIITFQACADLSLIKKLNNASPVPGENVVFTITVTNSGPSAATKVSVLDLLPVGLTYVTASATQGGYNANSGIWSIGTLAAGKTATLNITVVFNAAAENAVNCAEIYQTEAYDPDSTPNNRNTAEDDYDCVPFQTSKGPGEPVDARTEGGDDKAGSVLIFPVYSSSSVSPNLQNTRISITNISQTTDIAIKLLFVDGTSCSIADAYLCLTKNQTTSFITSDFDPDVSGYLIAIAVDCQTGCPVNFNCLIGDEYVKFASGHSGNIGAEAYNAVQNNPAGCDDSAGSATLKFDGQHYTRLPRTLIADNLPSQLDGNDTLIIIDRIGGNMMTGANRIGSIFGILFNDVEIGASFSFDLSACQLRSSLTNNFPRTAPRYNAHIPSGRSGWMKLFSRDETLGGIVGVMINFNSNARGLSNAFTGAHNLHHQTLAEKAEIIIPVFPPHCC